MNLAWADGGIAVGWQGIEPQVAQKCGGEHRQSITGNLAMAASPVGASMLAMNLRAPWGVRLPTSSLTPIATVRRIDMLAPTTTRMEPEGLS
ncbi:hypothetical protein DM828_10065 [Pseudomonas umsongensis]|jgi:hypothetical protein|nr:hypothetical protein [Pseudomonas umsongensis]